PCDIHETNAADERNGDKSPSNTSTPTVEQRASLQTPQHDTAKKMAFDITSSTPTNNIFSSVFGFPRTAFPAALARAPSDSHARKRLVGAAVATRVKGYRRNTIALAPLPVTEPHKKRLGTSS
ncbi:unnamed protein product, partial [Ectocarpus sp. 8 AP-2014]